MESKISMEKVKEVLDTVYQRFNIDNTDCNSSESLDADKVREVIDALYEETNKYEMMLDELKMKEHNLDMYKNKYVRISNKKEYICLYVEEIDRLGCYARFCGPGFESCLMWMSILHKSSTGVYYKDIKTRVKIITKEEFYKELDKVIEYNKEILKKNSKYLENKNK